MVLDIDKSTVLGVRSIESPAWGLISPRELSGGVKTLILMLFDENGYYYPANAMGDNCCKWILKISEVRDVHLLLMHTMLFPEDFTTPITLVDLDNKIVRSYDEYMLAVAYNHDRLGDVEDGIKY
ncbi:hypothetical protein AGMMS49975_20130 [Clostridia bacterium]|nr:hypothetical protein AGMMS49975_20130 [Clostridia bacterium]